MATDIFEFWGQISADACIHPADVETFRRVPNNGFATEAALPGCFMGPLRTAPIVLLYLSPGLSEEDKPTGRLKEWHVRTRGGTEPLVSKDVHSSAHAWWTQRTKILSGTVEQRSQNVATLNIGAYHSKTFNDHGLLAALPSSRVTLDWAQSVLFPEAEAGKRVVVCMRAARYWGLESGQEYSGTLFAPKVTRSGHALVANQAAIKKAAQDVWKRISAKGNDV
ncbi:MAG: hypothetical protein WBQ17_12460 [Rhizomicrobium sp.]